MANHSPLPDNYVGKKTWEEAMDGKAKPVDPAVEAQKDQDAIKRTAEKGDAARNGGGKK